MMCFLIIHISYKEGQFKLAVSQHIDVIEVLYMYKFLHGTNFCVLAQNLVPHENLIELSLLSMA